jgi:hypothetical protein
MSFLKASSATTNQGVLIDIRDPPCIRYAPHQFSFGRARLDNKNAGKLFGGDIHFNFVPTLTPFARAKKCAALLLLISPVADFTLHSLRRCFAVEANAALTSRELRDMAKGQQKSNKEVKKPKADKKSKGSGSTYKQGQEKGSGLVDSSGRKT